MRPRPTPEAIERIRGFGEKKIVEFFDEVPSELLQKIIWALPNVPGFRKKSPAGIKQQKKVLAKQLSSKNAGNRDFQALYLLWRSWGVARLGDSRLLEDLLESLENGAGDSKQLNEPKEPAETPDDRAVTLFAELQKSSHRGVCSRETIRRFFDFSPFSSHKSITDLVDNSKTSDDIKRETVISELPNLIQKDREDLEAIRVEIRELKSRMAAQQPADKVEKPNDRYDNELSSLMNRIQLLERHGPKESSERIEELNEGLSRGNQIKAIARGSSQRFEVMRLNDAANVLATLSETLQGLGLKKTAAKIFSEELLVAIVCSQVVFFKGSLGSAVAAACADAISANRSWVISIPSDLTDGGSLRESIQKLAAAGDDVATIILEGINRCSLDITRDALSFYPNGLCIATIRDGLASLPVEPAYFEYGPVFDLDCLEWRSRTSSVASVIFGNLSVEARSTIRESLQEQKCDTDEPLRLLAKFVSKRNVQIERNIILSFSALSRVKQESSISPLQSLAFGWLAPFWVAMGLSREDANSELDEGKLDASSIDPRVSAILSSWDSSKLGRSEPT